MFGKGEEKMEISVRIRERKRERVHATEREGREGPNRAMRQHAKEKQTMPLTATGKHGSAFIHVLCTFHVLHAIGVEN